MGDLVYLSDRLARQKSRIDGTVAADLKRTATAAGRTIVSSAHPRAIDILKSACASDPSKVLFLVESGEDVIPPSVMDSFATIYKVRTIFIDDEPEWFEIAAAWLRDKSALRAGLRAVSSIQPRRVRARKAGYRAAS